MNIRVCVSFLIRVFLLLDVYPGVGLLGHMLVLALVLLGF